MYVIVFLKVHIKEIKDQIRLQPSIQLMFVSKNIFVVENFTTVPNLLIIKCISCHELLFRQLFEMNLKFVCISPSILRSSYQRFL